MQLEKRRSTRIARNNTKRTAQKQRVSSGYLLVVVRQAGMLCGKVIVGQFYRRATENAEITQRRTELGHW